MVTSRQSVHAICAFTILVTGLPAAVALPSDQYVWNYVHTDPENPGDVLYAIRLKLVAQDIVGSSVAWSAAEVKILVIENSTENSWVDATPGDFDTPDGYWWIDHADPYQPVVMEFAGGPALEGSTDEEESCLDYAYAAESAYCDTECQAYFDGMATAISLEATYCAGGQPRISETHETVEISLGAAFLPTGL